MLGESNKIAQSFAEKYLAEQDVKVVSSYITLKCFNILNEDR